MRNKAISPLIATVLLIAFTIAVGGIISVFLTGFSKTQTKEVTIRSETELTCIYGGISISSLKYCNSRLSGIVENTRTISLGNLTLQIIYQNQSSEKINLNDSTGRMISLQPAELYSFNLSIPSNYDKIRIMTNCTTVSDTASRSDVSTSC